MMKMFIVAAALAASFNLYAQSSCSATNEAEDATCSITCAVGQAAVCSDGRGANAPRCECQGSSNDSVRDLLRKADKASSLTTPTQRVEQTDVLSTLNQKLAQLPDVLLEKTCRDIVVGYDCIQVGSCAKAVGLCRDICKPIRENKCQSLTGKLMATTPVILQSDPIVTVSEPNWNDIPSEVLGYRQTYSNCSDVEQSITFRHSETTKVGYRISKSQILRISEANNVSISAKASFKIGLDVSGQASRTVTRDFSVTDASETTEEETLNLDVTIPLKIPAMSLVTMEHSWVRREAPLPFKGTVTLDAPLIKNLEGKVLASNVLPSPSDRTFAFAGAISAAFTTEGQAQVTQHKLSPNQCAGGKAMKIESKKFTLR